MFPHVMIKLVVIDIKALLNILLFLLIIIAADNQQ